MSALQFQAEGHFTTQPLISVEHCQNLISTICNDRGQAGNREMLSQTWCASLANVLLDHDELRDFLPKNYGAIQCTYFEKSQETNWLVALHQDLSVPVANKFDHPDFQRYSNKGRHLYLQAPDYILRDFIALRLHLEDCTIEDGALGVLPGSHLHGRLSNQRVAELKQQGNLLLCPVKCGAALLMRPLLLHMSSKAQGQSKRRVLHFLFAPRPTVEGLNYLHFVDRQTLF